MTWSGEPYDALIAQLAKQRGQGEHAPQGFVVPNLTPADMLAILGMYTAGPLAAVDRLAFGCYRTDVIADLDNGIIDNVDYGSACPTQDYVGGLVPNAQMPWRRSVFQLGPGGVKSQSVITYEPVRKSTILASEHHEYIASLRELMSKFQTVINAVVSAISLGSPAEVAGRDAALAFVYAWRDLATSLDAIGEIIPESIGSRVLGAFATAKNASADAISSVATGAAKDAAQVANWAATTSADVVGIFLGNLALPLLVAGVAVVLALHYGAIAL